MCIGIIILGCSSEDVERYFEYPDHNVLNIGSRLTDLYITNDSNTLIVADKGNNRILFIDVSTDDMFIKKRVWVGSEPTSLDMTSDGRYLLVGLQGGSSVSIINMESLSFEGSLKLQEDSVFDIEYLSEKCQLIVSFQSADVNDTRTFIHAWWVDDDGEWYGQNTNCSYASDPEFVNPAISISETNIKTVEPPEIDNTQRGGLISVSDDESILYILDKIKNKELYRFEFEGDSFGDPISSSKITLNFEISHDLRFVNNFGVVVALDGTDPVNGKELDHAPVYDLTNLDHIGNLDLGSVPLAIAYDKINEHIYISPTDVDDNGMFIVEFSTETQLQTNYYQVAGLLGSHTLIVDPRGEYIYAAVDDLSDQDTHEPYNGSSFNIQKIKILPEGLFPINDF